MTQCEGQASTQETFMSEGTALNPVYQAQVGLYSIPEAARYLQTSPGTVARWKQHFSDRLRLPTSDPDERRFVGFAELIEMLYVKAFRDAGISLRTIRAAARRLQSEWGVAFPFASRRVDATQVRTLIARVRGDRWETADAGQQVFPFVELIRLHLCFGPDDLPGAWFPLGTDRAVVLDPTRSFGAPIDKDSGVPTFVLARDYFAEHENAAKVAWWYNVSKAAVLDAVEFERPVAA